MTENSQGHSNYSPTNGCQSFSPELSVQASGCENPLLLLKSEDSPEHFQTMRRTLCMKQQTLNFWGQTETWMRNHEATPTGTETWCVLMRLLMAAIIKGCKKKKNSRQRLNKPIKVKQASDCAAPPCEGGGLKGSETVQTHQ